MKSNPPRSKKSPLVAAAVFFVTVVPVLALAVSTALYLRQLGIYLDPRLAPLVAQTAADVFHREIRLDHIRIFDRPGTIVLQGLAVSNGNTFQAGHGLAFARIPQATVTYDLPGLLRDPADAEMMIRSVEVTRPSLYAEQLTPGKFNFSALIKPPNPAKPFPFRGVVLVKDGTLTVRDDNAPKILGVQRNQFSHVKATIDLTTPGRIAFQGTAAGTADRFASVGIHGDVLDPPSRAPATAVRGYALRVHVVRGNVPYLTDYFAPFLRKTFRIRQGIGDATVAVGEFGTTRPGPTTILGNADIRDGSFSLTDHTLLRRSLEAVNAHIAFTTTDLAIDGATSVSGTPLSVHGAIVDFAHPRLALSIDSKSLTYSGLRDALTFIPALPAGLSITAPATASVWVSGDLRRPRVEVSADLSALEYSGTTLTAIHATADYQDGILHVARAQARAPATDGLIDVRGDVLTRSKPLVYSVTGNVVNVNIAGLPLPVSARRQVGPLTGVASAQIQASNSGIQANFAASHATVKRILFDDVSGTIVWKSGTTVTVHRLVAHLADGGVFYADGLIPVGSHGGPWDLSVQATQIGLGRLVRSFIRVPIGGELYLAGVLRGQGIVPELTGNLTVLVPHYGSFVADELKGTFTASPNGVQFEQAVIRRFPGNAVISGRIARLASGDPSLNLRVTVDGAQLSDLTRFAAQQNPPPAAARAIAAAAPTLTGDLAAEFAVTGTFAHPRATGRVTLTDGTYSVIEINRAVADVAFAQDRIRVTRITGDGTGFQLSGAGSYEVPTHHILGQVHASIDDIGRLMPVSETKVPLAGLISLDIAASGTSDDPVATTHVSGQKLLVAGVPLDGVSLDARYERGQVTGTNQGLEVSSGSARYQVSDFRYNLRTTEFGLTGQVTGETISHLVALARDVHLPVGGGVHPFQAVIARLPQNADGQIVVPLIHAEGTIKHPSVRVLLDATNVVYDAERLDTVHADARYANDAFDIASLEARGKPNAYLSIGGQIDPDGPVNAHLEASGIDLAPLNSFFPLGRAVGGQISDLTIVATGQTRAPVLDASVTLDRPSYGSVSVDSLDSGRISIGNDQIVVNGLQVVKDETTPSGQVIEHLASVRGSLPFAWKAGAALVPVFPRNVPLSFTLTIPSQNLSSLPALFPSIPVKFPSGTISANIGLGGTLENQKITGSVVVANGAVQTSLLKTSLHDVNLNLSLVGQQARVAFTADSSAGGSIRVTGGGSLTGASSPDSDRFVNELLGGIRMDLVATASNFLVDEPKITQFGNAGFRGKVNGSIRVTQALRSPLVSGNITLSDAIGVLPSLSQTAGEAAPEPLIDPQFQLGVAVARGSRLRNSLLDAQIDGGLSVAGTLAQPNVVGDFFLRQGTFRFPTATFRVVPVGTVHLSYVPPNDPIEQVNLTAQTQINVSDATIAANPAGAGSEPDAYGGPRSIPASQLTRNYTITVTIEGLLNNPNQLKLDFQSDPAGLTQAQILATIGGQQALAGVSQAFTTLAVPLALEPVERGIASGLGLEDFTIAYSPEAPVALTFVKRLGPRIGLTYTQMVNSRSTGAVANTLEPPIFQVKLDYSFTDRFRLSLSTDDQRNTIIGLERVYSF